MAQCLKTVTLLACLMGTANVLVFVLMAWFRDDTPQGAHAMAEDPAVSVLVLSPHPDDAVRSAFGALWGRGRSAEIVTVFAGTPSVPVATVLDRECGFEDSSQARETWAREDRRALARVGCGALRWDHLEAQYRLRPKDPNYVPPSVVAARVRDDIARLVVERATARWPGEAGNRLAVMAPMTRKNSDHRELRAVFAQVACELVDFFANATAFAEPGTYRPVEFWLYEDYPHVPLVPTDVPTFVERTDGHTYETHALGLNQTVWDAKWSALGEYRSQAKIFPPYGEAAQWHRERCSTIGVAHKVPVGIVACEVFYRLASAVLALNALWESDDGAQDIGPSCTSTPQTATTHATLRAALESGDAHGITAAVAGLGRDRIDGLVCEYQKEFAGSHPKDLIDQRVAPGLFRDLLASWVRGPVAEGVKQLVAVVDRGTTRQSDVDKSISALIDIALLPVSRRQAVVEGLRAIPVLKKVPEQAIAHAVPESDGELRCLLRDILLRKSAGGCGSAHEVENDAKRLFRSARLGFLGRRTYDHVQQVARVYSEQFQHSAVECIASRTHAGPYRDLLCALAMPRDEYYARVLKAALDADTAGARAALLSRFVGFNDKSEVAAAVGAFVRVFFENPVCTARRAMADSDAATFVLSVLS
eukprot:m51a1_g8180 hypothetical protein (648) ;mRNA; f:124382-126940